MSFPQSPEHLKPYGTFNEEIATQKGSSLTFLGEPIHEPREQNPHQGEDYAQLRPKSTQSNEGYFHFESEGENYPPGITVTGSRHLPIPEVTTDLSTAKKKKRHRNKKRSVAPLNTEEEQLSGQGKPNPSEKEINEAKVEGNALHTPVYKQPTPPVSLPPIKAKSNVAATAPAASVLPAIAQTNRPEPVGEEMKNFNEGATNELFVGETSFVSNNDDINATTPAQLSKSTVKFNDEERVIDYVLAYEEDDDEKDEEKKQQVRDVYEKGLTEAGLELELEPKENSQNNKTYFLKVHVPWPVLLKYAERMKMKLPLKENKEETETDESDDVLCGCCSSVTNCMNRCIRPCMLRNPIVEEQFGDCDYYTAEFTRDKIEFFDMKDQGTFFRTNERSRIANRIMSETRYGDRRVQIGLDSLLLDSVYCAAYPLHEGLYTGKDPKLAKDDNIRRMLYWEWARWGRWYKFQPLNLIRHYLGDKIGLYFAWLGFYTNMLLIPTFVGLVCFLYSIITVWTYPPTQEVCDEDYPTYAGNLTMCPLCDQFCTYWKLTSSCLAARITYVFDNTSTIFFAVFMSLWATMFLEFWKRRQFTLSYEWDLVDYDEDRDLIRPEYEVLVEREKLNPITGKMEPFLHPRDRYSRAAFSIITVVFWVAVIIAAVFAVIVYRIAINVVFATNVDLTSLGAISSIATPSMLTTITASLISLLIIMILNKIYEKVAFALTKLELPRTQTDFDDSFTFKMFCFQFVNFYAILFYIAFFKNSFAGYPADYNYLFGKWRWEECDAGGCMYELTLQLVIIMFGKQLWNNILELVLPWVLNKYRQWKSRKASEESPENEYTRWEQDYDLTEVQNMDLFHEYLEMVIQFGFVTLFVTAFPLAPVLALINNIVEIRLDANKFVCEYRRPLAQKCSDIGAWYFLLEFIGTLSVVTNAFTIAITSESIPKLVYYYFYSTLNFPESTYVGFTNNSLSIFDVKDFSSRSMPLVPTLDGVNVTECRYRDYRSPPTANPPYALTIQYWHIFAARLAFVIVMEHVVFFLKRFLDYLIPDRPQKLKEKIKREHFLVQEMLFHAERLKLEQQYSRDADRQNGSTSSTSKPPPSPSTMVYENERATTPL